MKLIFHIGAGKTGTSSIQATLKANAPVLQARGVLYLGLMFEHSPARLFEWQRFGGQDEFLALPQAEAEAQFNRVLQATLRRGREAGVHSMIWSSESFFDRFDAVLGPLQRACEQGLDLAVLAYVRAHETWARSAYIQWGLKHKTYPGRLRSFGEWVAHRKPLFAPTLARYDDAFPGRLTVRNFDAAGDVVDDFCEFAGLADLPLERVHENHTPDDTELFLRALFNDRQDSDALPMVFDKAVGRLLPQAASPTAFLQGLYPHAADIEQVARHAHADRQAIDALLVQQGQPPLQTGAITPKQPRIDDGRLLGALARLCIANARRLDALEAEDQRLRSGGEPL